MGAHDVGKWGRANTAVEPSVWLGGLARAWCYVCKSAHAYGEPCLDGTVFILGETVPCANCGRLFEKGHGRRFCSGECRVAAYRELERAARAAR